MDFLDQLILDNPVRHLMAVLAVIMTVFFLRTRVSRYLASLLHIPLQRKWKSVSRERFASLIIKPLGRFLGFAVAGCEPDEMGIGPVFAVPKVLARLGLKAEDIDLWS